MSHHADIFVHYSNLDAAMRRDVEERFAASPVAICVSTSTLELGVDIDSVDDVALLGAPPEQIAVLPQERGHFLFHFWGTVWGELLTAVLVANGISADFVNEYCLAVPQPITQLPPGMNER